MIMLSEEYFIPMVLKKIKIYFLSGSKQSDPSNLIQAI